MTTVAPTRTTAPTPAPSIDVRRLRAVLYVRISDDPEGLEKGVERQEADCRTYAEAQRLRGRRGVPRELHSTFGPSTIPHRLLSELTEQDRSAVTHDDDSYAVIGRRSDWAMNRQSSSQQDLKI